MPRTPDRFEKTVRRAARKDEWGMLVMDSNEVIDLLRKEHAWMVRMVKGLTVYRFPNGPFVDPYYISRQALLRKLTQRRK